MDLLNALYMMSGLVKKQIMKLSLMRLKVKYLIWLATTTVLNDVKNKIPNVRILVIKVNYDAKILEIVKNILQLLDIKNSPVEYLIRIEIKNKKLVN